MANQTFVLCVQNTILRGSLEIYRQALGEHYVDVDPILLGSAGTVINLLSSVVDEELLEIEAAAIKGLSANHGLLIRRFPQWQLYLDDIRGNDVEASAASASFDSVRKIVEATQLVGFVDNNIPRTLAILDDASSRKPNGDNSVVTSLFRSVSNVVARVAQRALQDFVKELRPTGIKLVTGATYGAAWEFIKGISHSLSDLAVKIPNLFEWVRPVLQVLGLL